MKEFERKRRLIDFMFDLPDLHADIRRKFDCWILGQENDLAVDRILRELWESHIPVNMPEETRRGLLRLHEAIDRRRGIRKRIVRWTSAAAAVLLIFAGGYLTATNARHSTPDLILLAGRDNAGEFTLPDGTRVWLNGESRLTCPAEFAGSAREVSLSGEAYFEVQKDSLRPFRVQMNRLQIEVLGTSFDAIGYASGSCDEVILRTGSVRVTNSSLKRPIVLKPNQRLCLDHADNTIRIERVDAENYCRWFESSLIFDNTPFREILINLERRYHTEISFPETVPLDKRLSLTVNREPLEHIMEVIAALLPVEYEIRSDRMILTDKH